MTHTQHSIGCSTQWTKDVYQEGSTQNTMSPVYYQLRRLQFANEKNTITTTIT